MSPGSRRRRGITDGADSRAFLSWNGQEPPERPTRSRRAFFPAGILAMNRRRELTRRRMPASARFYWSAWSVIMWVQAPSGSMVMTGSDSDASSVATVRS